ncbi:MAG: hypothetical protein RJQ09_02940 [Cyclobacteriaceae bacterium]
MIKDLRQEFNKNFTEEKYQQFLKSIHDEFNHVPNFRIAETPVFIPANLRDRLIEACEEITDVICDPGFPKMTEGAIHFPHQEVPNEDAHTTFLQMDFGICYDEHGELIPQLIEIQGFPSLYFFQNLLANKRREHFDLSHNLTHLLNGYTEESYTALLRDAIIADHEPENVILLEIEPEKQTTQIDFWATEKALGIKTVCLSKLIVRGKEVFYKNDKGKEIKVERIYNRVIFDELMQRDDLPRQFFFTQEYDVEWAGHPNWFFRISKYTMPYLKSKYVPETSFLRNLHEYPGNLQDYVLKPLYSFAGSGVKLDFTAEELDLIKNKPNFILQKKVTYQPVIQTPNDPAKCEIRMLMVWPKDAPRPIIVNNLARLSKGKMIGVKYNKDKDWVGASVGFFEK